MLDFEPNLTIDLIEQARRRPDAIALALPDREINYRQLDQITWQCTQFLYDQGIREGDVVALTFENEILLALTLLGVARLGATTLSIPRSATAFQRREWIAQAKCNVYLSDRSGQYETGIPAISITGSDIGRQGFVNKKLLHENPTDPLSIIVGSGSTGKPKLIPITHAQMRHRCDLSITHSSYLPSDRIFSLSHMEFASATNRLFSSLGLGACFVFSPVVTFDLVSFLKMNRVTVLFGAVLHMERILRSVSEGDKQHLDFLRIIRVAGSTVSSDLRTRIKNILNSNLHVIYGTNECGRISIAASPEVFDTPGTVGFPISGVVAEVMNEKDEKLVGSPGFIRVRTPSMIKGYLGEKSVSRKNFRDGWFYTGDIGQINTDGQIIFQGRSDDLMIFNGINIYPAEIEQCLIENPDIQDVAVVPVRHSVHQDVPVCALVLRHGSETRREDIEADARKKLGFKCPKRFIFLDSIPRNSQGKLGREELAQILIRILKIS